MKSVLEDFIIDIARPYLEHIFQNLYASSLNLDFDSVFKRIKDFDSFKIEYVSFTLLRTNLLYENYIYEVYAYDKEWYLNGFTKIAELDVSSIFGWIDEAREHLTKESKRYLGKINSSDITNIISKSLNDFESFFIESFYDYNMDRSHSFIIYTGELHGELQILCDGEI